jgi:hypothetical protein
MSVAAVAVADLETELKPTAVAEMVEEVWIRPYDRQRCYGSPIGCASKREFVRAFAKKNFPAQMSHATTS